jgi:vacuolar-type H+-ATPase subunit E/Vma4
MNETSNSAPEDEIIHKILSDGEALAKREIDNARRAEGMEKRKANAEAERIREEMLAQAERKVRVLRSKGIASARIEAKRIALKAREGAISKVVGLVEQGLANLREEPDRYGEALHNLAAEAVSTVGESEVTLKFGKDDEGIADAQFIAAVTQKVYEMQGAQVKIALEYDTGLVGGGCMAVSKHGRIVFDNTFRRRLERMKPALRTMIVKEVLKTDV